MKRCNWRSRENCSNVSANACDSVSSLKILFAVNVPFPEGRANTRRIRTIGRELANQGHSVFLLLPHARVPQARAQAIEGIHVEWAYTPSSPRAFLNEKNRIKLWVQLVSRICWLIRLWRYSRSGAYDWLYLYQPGIDGLIAALIARLWGRRICSEYVDILTAEGYRGVIWGCIYALQQIADRIVPLLSHKLLVISHHLQGIYQIRSRAAVVAILPVLVDTERFSGGDGLHYRRKLGLGERPVIAFTGSFTAQQGLATLIKAMVKVVHHTPDVMLLIAGWSLASNADDADALIEEFNLSNNAKYVGSLPEEDVINLQAAADILVIPKLDHPVNHAGLSTKLAEYLASGKAVVVSRVGDVARYLVHEQDALLIQAGDRTELEEALIRLLDDRTLCRRLGQNGRLVAQREFDASSNVAQLVRLLGDL